MAWRDYIGNDTGWKLFSLLLAILIWGSVRPRNEGGVPLRPVVTNPLQNAVTPSTFTSEPISRPVTVLRQPADSHRYRVTPPMVAVVVQGDSDLLKTVNGNDITVFVNAAEFDGNTNSPLDKVACAIQIHVPEGVHFVKSDPSAVTVERLPVPADETQAVSKP